MRAWIWAVWIPFVASCVPGGRVDERPAIQRGEIVATLSSGERIEHGSLLPAAGFRFGTDFHAELRFAMPYLCRTFTLGSRYRLLVGRGSLPIAPGSVECISAGVGTDIRVPIPDFDATIPREDYEDRFATLEVTVLDDGTADRIEADGTEVHASGEATYRFYVVFDTGGTPSAVHVVSVSPLRDAPGWDDPIAVAERDGYLEPSGNAIVADVPLMAHETLALGTDQPMISFSARDALSDFEGIVWQSGGAGGPIGDPFAPTAAFSRVFTETDVGLVPGERYVVALTGRASADTMDIVPVQGVTGGLLEPRAELALAGDDELEKADTRFVFDVFPVRIERPNRTAVTGRGAVGLSVGPPTTPDPVTIRIPLDLIAPKDALDPADRWLATIATAGSEIANETGTWPAGPAIARSLQQSGREFPDMEASVLVVPVPTAPVAADGVEIEIDLTLIGFNAGLVARDRRRATLDLVNPTLAASMCNPGASSGCLLVDDDDERDCFLPRVCVEASSDAVALEIVYCGERRIVPLTRDGALACARDVSFSGTREGSSTSRPFSVVAIDDAGNESAPRTYDQASSCPLPPRRFVPTGPVDVAAHARGDSGPLAFVGVGGNGTVLQWNGAIWASRFVHPPAVGEPIAWEHRGRADALTLADGSVVFCATRRPRRNDPHLLQIGHDVFEPAELELIHVDPSGVARGTSMPGARALGCALAQNPIGAGQVGVAFAEIGSGGAPAPIRAAFAECEIGAGGLDCAIDTTFRATANGQQLLGFEPDVTYSALGSPMVVGRGVRADGRIEERRIYVVRSLTAVTVLQRHVHVTPCRHVQVPDELFDSVGRLDPARQTFVFWEGGLTPRIERVSGGRMVVVYTRYAHQAELVDSFPRSRITASISTRTETVARLLGVGGAPLGAAPVTVGLGYLGEAPPPLWPDGILDRPSDEVPPAPGCSLLGEADITIAPIDLESDGTTALAGWASRPMGDEVRPILQLPGRVTALRRTALTHEFPEDPAFFVPSPSLVSSRLTVGGAGGITVSSQMLDVEVGDHDEILDLALGRGARALTEPSVLYERSDRGSGGFHDLLYGEARAGQFFFDPAGAGELGASDSCAGSLMSAITLTDKQTRLVPDPPPELQYPWTSMQMGTATIREAYSNASAGLTCLLNQQVEGMITLTGVDDPSFDLTVRDDVVDPVLSFASSFGGRTPAMLLSTRFSLTGTPPTLGPGTLIVEINGTSRTATLAEATTFEDAIVSLNTQLGGSIRSPRVALAPIGPDPTEPIAARATLLAPRTFAESPPATLTVRPSTLATQLGVPVNKTATSSGQIDVAFGDTSDRFRPCEPWTPCTPGPAGTCDLPQDCIPVGTPLVGELVREVALRESRPPLRQQTSVCVPTSQLSSGHSDSCEPGVASYRGGYPGSYVAPVFRSRSPCRRDFGEAPAGTNRCMSCGRPSPASSTDPLDRAGAPRLCDDDDDCQPERDCPASLCPAVGNMLCTHMGGTFMGVPAGQGFCAAPVPCRLGSRFCAARAGLPAGLGIEIGVSGVAPRPLDPAEGDFRPSAPAASGGGGVECVQHGCISCLGDVPNGYCLSDAECPPDHSCLTPARAESSAPTQGSPLCILRPLLQDGRLDRVERAVGEGARPDVAALGAILLPALVNTRNQLRASAASLAIAPRITIRQGETLLQVQEVEAEIGALTSSWTQVPVASPAGYTSGSAQLWVTIEILGNIRVRGIFAYGSVTPSDFSARFRARAIQLRLAPFVDASGALRLRLADSVMLRDFDERSLPVPVGALDVTVEGELRDALVQLLFGVQSVFTLAGIPGSVFVIDEIVRRIEETVSADQIIGGTGLGGVARFYGPVLQSLGEDLVMASLFGSARIEPAALLENARGIEDGLELRYRGSSGFLPVEAFLLRLANSRVRGCCDAADADGTPEPHPDCLQTGPGIGFPTCVAEIQASCAALP